MSTVPKFLHLDNLRHGRSGIDPFDVVQGQVAEAQNVDGNDGMLGRKRPGADNTSTVGGTAFSGTLSSLARWVPGSSEALAQLWGVDASFLMKRQVPGAAFADVTLSDAITAAAESVTWAALNGKLYIAFQSAASRLHVFDPLVGSVRRVGIAPGAVAPTAADAGGAGAYPNTPIYYRCRFLQMSGATIVRRSEPTPALFFTPSAANAGVNITRPTAPGESETHWEIEVSLDGITFYVLYGIGSAVFTIFGAPIVIGTTTQFDTTLQTAFSGGQLSDPTGFYTLPHAARYLVSDNNRLIFAGDFMGVQPGSRIWYTPVLNSALKGDDERYVLTDYQKNYLDVGLKDGGDITALAPPLDGVILVFKYKSIWKLYPTGNPLGPYLWRKDRDDIGCVDQNTVCAGRTMSGSACIYFWDALTGPWRYSASGGYEYLGRDVEDITKRVNLAATHKVAHSIWHSSLHQWWTWLSVDGGNDPSIKMVFDPHMVMSDEEGLLRRGWYKHTGDSASARSSCMFANTLGVTMSMDLKPYVGIVVAGGAASLLYKCDSDTAKDDNGVPFQAFIDSSPVFPPLESGTMIGVGRALLTAKAAAAVTIQVSIEADFGGTSRTKVSTCVLTPDSTETRVFRSFDDSDFSDITALQVRLGDSAAVSSGWVLDRLSFPILQQGSK